MITKEQLETIDHAFERAIEIVRPLVAELRQSDGIHADCYALSAWGDLIFGANKINKAKELV